MTRSETEVAIIGGGAAGIAAGRRLREAGVDCLLIEARAAAGRAGLDDCRCFRFRARPRLRLAAFGRPQSVGESRRRARPHGRQDAAALDQAVAAACVSRSTNSRNSATRWTSSMTVSKPCSPKAATRRQPKGLEPGGRWNDLIIAVGTYISGTELGRMSGARFHQLPGLGRELERARGLWRDHRSRRRRTARRTRLSGAPYRSQRQAIENRNGKGHDHGGFGHRHAAERRACRRRRSILRRHCLKRPMPRAACRSVLPTSCSSRSPMPTSSSRTAACSVIPTASATASYQLRPFGRPMIEAYFGGSHAAALEAGGERALLRFRA